MGEMTDRLEGEDANEYESRLHNEWLAIAETQKDKLMGKVLAQLQKYSKDKILAFLYPGGKADIWYNQRPWLLEILPHEGAWTGEWMMRLHDLAGPVNIDGSPGKQPPGTIVETVGHCMDTELVYWTCSIWKALRFHKPTHYPYAGHFKTMDDVYICRDNEQASYSPAHLHGYTSRKLSRMTLNVGEKEWAVFFTRAEFKKVVHFLQYLASGYQPPDNILSLEGEDVTLMMHGAPSKPVTWSQWRDLGWTLRQVWTAKAAQAEQAAR